MTATDDAIDKTAQSAEPNGITAAGPEMMEAVVQDSYGSAPEQVLRLAKVVRPTIGAHEVLLQVRAASVDRGTWHVMARLPCPIDLQVLGCADPRVSIRATPWRDRCAPAGRKRPPSPSDPAVTIRQPDAWH